MINLCDQDMMSNDGKTSPKRSFLFKDLEHPPQIAMIFLGHWMAA